MRLRCLPRSPKPDLGRCKNLATGPAPGPAGRRPHAQAGASQARPLGLGLGLGLGLLGPALLAVGCNPYERHGGEYLAGAVDPVQFPAAYLGKDGDGKKPGSGTFQYVKARVRGTAISYYPLPFSGAQAQSDDPLDLGGDPPLAYVFDPLPGSDGAAADSARCVKPAGYAYDVLHRREEGFRLDRQGNVFTGLPAESDPAGSSSYVPVVSEVVVASNGEPCQDATSEASIVTRIDVTLSLSQPAGGAPGALPVARPSGRLLAMAIIDPAADVRYADPAMPYDPLTQLGPQRWGFYAQYLLAYLDGGYIPQQIVYGPKAPAGSRRMIAQDLYYPSQHPTGKLGKVGPGALGEGFDVLQFRRGEDGYSPVCRVLSFAPKDPSNPETSIASIDPAAVTDTGRYIYCLQLP